MEKDNRTNYKVLEIYAKKGKNFGGGIDTDSLTIRKYFYKFEDWDLDILWDCVRFLVKYAEDYTHKSYKKLQEDVKRH